MLGERIRAIRKLKKMTLEALAGDQLTKGMLSQIENNKARPSMESLEYIATRLGVEVSELLENISAVEIRKVLEEAEQIFDNTRIYFKHAKETVEISEKLIALIEPLIPNLNERYESGRLLEIYSKSLFCVDNEEWKKYCDKAAQIFDLLNLASNRADIGLFKGITYYVEHRFTEALHCYLAERSHLESHFIKIDPMTKVNLDYHAAAIYSAIGDIEATSEAVERALDYSKKEKLYYKTDDIYKLAAAVALMVKEEEKFHYYLKKLRQYGDFVEDKAIIELCDILYVEYLLHVNKQYQEAMPLIDRYLTIDESTKKIAGDNLNMLLKGKVLYYTKDYDHALEILQTIYVPKEFVHPIDLALVYIKDTFIALCYKELHNKEKAFEHAKIAYDRFASLPHSLFKNLCIETFESLR